MRGIVAMSERERARLVEMELVAKGRESLVEAGRRLGLSYRQVKRVWARYRAAGARGVGAPKSGERVEPGEAGGGAGGVFGDLSGGAGGVWADVGGGEAC